MDLRKMLSGLDPVDVVAVVSVAVLAVGIAMVSVPGAFVVVGGLGLVYAVAVSRAGGAET
jgi:hypothetical protein